MGKDDIGRERVREGRDGEKANEYERGIEPNMLPRVQDRVVSETSVELPS
jgi:hypothetical protein